MYDSPHTPPCGGEAVCQVAFDALKEGACAQVPCGRGHVSTDPLVVIGKPTQGTTKMGSAAIYLSMTVTNDCPTAFKRPFVRAGIETLQEGLS